eukprot:190265_1
MSPSLRGEFLLAGHTLQVVSNEVPVDDTPNVLEVIRATVLEVGVVSVLPHIDGEHRSGVAIRGGGGSVASVGDGELLLGHVVHQPGPAGAEVGDTRRLELGLKVGH